MTPPPPDPTWESGKGRGLRDQLVARQTICLSSSSWTGAKPNLMLSTLWWLLLLCPRAVIDPRCFPIIFRPAEANEYLGSTLLGDFSVKTFSVVLVVPCLFFWVLRSGWVLTVVPLSKHPQDQTEGEMWSTAHFAVTFDFFISFGELTYCLNLGWG